MELALKAKKKNLGLAIALTVGLIVGIPCIVVGAVKMGDVKAFAALLAVGIVLTVLGFYGSPIAWSRMSSVNQELTLVQAVTTEHLYTVADLSQRLNLKGKHTSVGYIREGDTLVLNENRALGPTVHDFECPRCGAPISVTAGEKARCPYCGSPVTPPEAK